MAGTWIRTGGELAITGRSVRSTTILTSRRPTVPLGKVVPGPGDSLTMGCRAMGCRVLIRQWRLQVARSPR